MNLSRTLHHHYRNRHVKDLVVLSSYLEQITCPICTTPFVTTERALTCAHGHCFDLAKEGYVNFLRTPTRGDTKEMLKARQYIFAQNYYRPLSDTINELLCSNLTAQVHTLPEPCIICDAGCGDGYYLSRLQTALATHLPHHPIRYLGLDISKEAVRMAAKRCPNAFFIVADLNTQLALTDASCHVILNIFAPRNHAEFARLLRPGGLLLVVIPAPTHLATLRQTLHLLHIEENKQQHVIAQFTTHGHFQFESLTPVTYEFVLPKADIPQLVTMTPNHWHATADTHRIMAQLAEIRTEIACLCLAFRRI